MTTDKPTDAMIEAGLKAREACNFHGTDERKQVAEIYRYMHEARPQSAAPSPDADLVERVARAICWAFEEDCGGCDNTACITAGHCAATQPSDCMVRDAKAAIEALTATAHPSDASRITPEWCINMAKLEEGHEVGAGVLALDPTSDCPHASPHRYCEICKVSPCPISLGRPAKRYGVFSDDTSTVQWVAAHLRAYSCGAKTVVPTNEPYFLEAAQVAIAALSATPPSEEREPPHGYTRETWAAKQAEVAEFSRRNPYDDPATGIERKRNSEERLRAAANIQCGDVPDQFALVRRGDILNVLHELIRHRAGHELAIEQRKAAPPSDSDDLTKCALALFTALEKRGNRYAAVKIDGPLNWTITEPRTERALLDALETDEHAIVERLAAKLEPFLNTDDPEAAFAIVRDALK